MKKILSNILKALDHSKEKEVPQKKDIPVKPLFQNEPMSQSRPKNPEILGEIILQKELKGGTTLDKESVEVNLAEEILRLSYTDLLILKDKDETSDQLAGYTIEKYKHNEPYDVIVTDALIDWLKLYYDVTLPPELFDMIHTVEEKEKAARESGFPPKKWKEIQDELLVEKSFRVTWSKTYVASGDETVTARSSKEAREKILDEIADLTGSMQYCPDQDTAEAYPID